MLGSVWHYCLTAMLNETFSMIFKHRVRDYLRCVPNVLRCYFCVFLAEQEKQETKDFDIVDKKTKSEMENFDDGDIRVPRKVEGVQIIQQLLNQRVSNMSTKKPDKAGTISQF